MWSEKVTKRTPAKSIRSNEAEKIFGLCSSPLVVFLQETLRVRVRSCSNLGRLLAKKCITYVFKLQDRFFRCFGLHFLALCPLSGWKDSRNIDQREMCLLILVQFGVELLRIVHFSRHLPPYLAGAWVPAKKIRFCHQLIGSWGGGGAVMICKISLYVYYYLLTLSPICAHSDIRPNPISDHSNIRLKGSQPDII
jgi:hypothetical protein